MWTPVELEKSDCHFVPNNSFVKFAIINIANNGLKARHLLDPGSSHKGPIK